MFTLTNANVLTRRGSSNYVMTKDRINKINVDRCTPGATETVLWDDKVAGFGLKVMPTGAKSYLFQYRIGGRAGRTRRFTIGRHGSLTPEAARKIADGLSSLVAKGIDPQQAKQDKNRRAIDLAFEDYAERFVGDCLKVRWKASYLDAKALLVRYAIPVLGSKPLPDIDRSDIKSRRCVAECAALHQ